MRLRGGVPLGRHVAFGHGPLFNRPHRLSVRAVEGVDPALFRRLRERLDSSSVDRNVGENRRARNIPVPDAVVDELVVPDPLAGFQVERDQAFGEQVVARTMTAEEIVGGCLHRQIDDAELLVDAHLAPHADVAGVGPRVVQPGVIAEFAGPRNGVEDPHLLAGADVEAAHESLFMFRLGRAGRVSGADDDGVLRNHRCRVQAHFAGDQVDGLVVVFFQIDLAVLAESTHRESGSGVERNHHEAGRDVDHTMIVASVGPVRQAAARESAGGRFAALALVFAVHPQHLAGVGLDGDHRPSRAAGEIHHAVDDQRCHLQVELGPRPEGVGLESPGDLEIVEVRRVNLCQR